LISILKILDKEFYFSLKNETPITQENKTINCLGALSYLRPDFQIFREMVIDTFTPEPETQLIIILPCSSKKPYSDSKSHKKFATAIRKYPDFPNFQEIIITSPLGAIPRQLENVYPVNSYDISVTGFWDEEELAIASEMLVKILDKYNQEIPIICHLEGGYVEIVEKAQKKLNRKFYFSQINNKITAIESLNSLETLIRTYKDEYSAKLDIKTAKTLSKSWHRKLLKLLDYQFGIDSATKVFSNGLLIKEKKDKNQKKIIDPITKDILGFFKYSSGQIALSMKGAEKLVPYEHSKFLVFNGEKITGNTLFRPGILEYSNNLFPNDYVLILDNTKQNLIGLGQMIVGSDFLRNSKTGRIAKVYENK
jgi:archaeosine synthase